MVVTDPRVSTAGSRRTSALRRAIARAPNASATVTTAGRASGIAATARLTAVRSMIGTGSPRSQPRPKTRAQIASAASANRRPSTPSRRWSGVAGASAPRSSAAMRPSSVRGPVSSTTPRPRPRATTVPFHAWPCRSGRSRSAASGPATTSFSTGADSPVRADSSTRRRAASRRRRSAGTTFPASSRTTSPGTSPEAGSVSRAPSRRTVAVGAASARSAASAPSARSSCAKPIAPFRSRIAPIASVSAASPIRPAARAAASSRRIGRSVN